MYALLSHACTRTHDNVPSPTFRMSAYQLERERKGERVKGKAYLCSFAAAFYAICNHGVCK